MTRMPRKIANGMLALLMLGAFTASLPVRAQGTGSPASVGAQGAAASQEKGSEQGESAEQGDEQYRQSPTVAKLGSMMGMKSSQASTVFTLTNLAILLAGLGYLLMKNLPKAFKGRSATIQKQIVEARTATQDAKSRLSSVEARLAKLDGEIAALRTQAEADGAREEERLKAAIEEEKQRILAAAGQEIQSATLTARRELQTYAAGLAVDQAARNLVVTPESDRLLVAGFAQRLQAFGKGEN